MTIWDVGNSPIVVASEDRTREPIPFTSSNLEFVDDDLSWPGPGIGLLLNGLDIPQGSRITDAYIQFQVEGANRGAAALQIFGEDTDNAASSASAKDADSGDKVPPYDVDGPRIAIGVKGVIERSGLGANEFEGGSKTTFARKAPSSGSHTIANLVGLNSAGFALADVFPSVTTDKGDYAPGRLPNTQRPNKFGLAQN